MKRLLAAAYAFLCVQAFAADITSARVSTYDWETQDAAGVRIAGYARQDTAIVGCINSATCTFIVGGKYKISRAVVVPPVVTPPASGSAALSWTPPTSNTDGTPLTNVSGYKVYHGTSATGLTDVKAVTGTTYQFTGLASGTHYFAVSTVTALGFESALSAVGSKVIP